MTQATLLSVAVAAATVSSLLSLVSAQGAGAKSPLDSLTQKTYGTEYHMPAVRAVHARVQSDKPELQDGRFVSMFGADVESGYLHGLDTVNTASVEGALMFVQAAEINQNARAAAERCTRPNGVRYVVLFELLIAQTNETLAQFESSWSVPEYGPLVPTDGGACTANDDGTFPPECLQFNGDKSQPKVGPFVGARRVFEDARAPYPDTYWFSFPNTCPLKTWSEKTDACRAATRQGLCAIGQAPDGVACTFAYDILGYVPLDDLVGITSLKDTSGAQYKNFTTWCQASEKNVEFAGDTTTGKMDKGLAFWADPLNATRNSERAAKVIQLYQDIVTGDFKSGLVPSLDRTYFKSLPDAKTLAVGNPPCYKSVRACNSADGCARAGFSQICRPCKTNEACATDASYTRPTLDKAKTVLSEAELTSGAALSGSTGGGTLTWCGSESCAGSQNTTTPGAPTPAPGSSDSSTGSSSGLTMALIVGGVVLVVVALGVFFLRRKLCACCRRRREHAKLEPPTLAGGETATSADGVYVDMSTPETLPSSAVGVRSQKSESSAKPTTVTTKADTFEFPGQLLLAVRIPFEELQIGAVISQGGFGEVSIATYHNQDVAVKRLLAARQRDQKSLRSFVQEIELNATLDHECLVRFLGAAWDVRENLCMVSEFVRGGDLRALLSQYASNGHPNGHDGGKLRTAVQVAQALVYLHSLDPPVVHRDLKSRNVLLTELLDAKLIDFGVSTECVDETMTAGVGTSLWMAPEIMLGRRYDEKADVFSFGVILSELDTHAIPYDHVRDPESNRKLASALLNRLIYEGRVKPRFTEMADPEIVALARDCLEVDPSRRPTAAQVLDRIRGSGRQGGRPLPPPITTAATTHADTHNSMLFETRATTQGGR